ncbi:MAG: SPASM domain-containing protein [bacterium]
MLAILPAYEGMNWGNSKLDFLSKVGGKSVLEHVLEKIKSSGVFSEVVVLSYESAAIKGICESAGAHFFAGHPQRDKYLWIRDVLDQKKGISDFMIIEPASPLLDVDSIRRVVEHHIRSDSDLTFGRNNFYTLRRSTYYRACDLMDGREQIKGLNLDWFLQKQGWFRQGGVIRHESVPDYCIAVNLIYYCAVNQIAFRIESVEGADFEWFFNMKLTVDDKDHLSLLQEVFDRFYPQAIHDSSLIANYLDKRGRIGPMKSVPIGFAVEITNDGNLERAMGPWKAMTRRRGYMKFVIFKKIIDDIKSLEGFAQTLNRRFILEFAGFGEPLLHPNFREMLEYIVNRRFAPNVLSVYLNTDGANLNGKTSEFIVRSGLTGVIFHLNAVDEEGYRRIMGKDGYPRVVENIYNLLRIKNETTRHLRKEYGQRLPLVGVQIVKSRETDAIIGRFVDQWDFKRDIKRDMKYNKKLTEIAEIRDRDERKKKIKELEEAFWEKFYGSGKLPLEHCIISGYNSYCGQIEDRGVMNCAPIKRSLCKQLKDGLTILWTGDVVLCGQDFDGENVIENVKNRSLVEIFNDERLVKLREEQKRGDFTSNPLCAKCDRWYLPIE